MTMGFTPPPPPVDRETFIERLKNGARTLEELDPELFAWKRQREKDRRIILWCMMLALITGVVIFLFV